MDAVDSVVDPLREFAKDSVRLVKRCHKPDRKGMFLAFTLYCIDLIRFRIHQGCRSYRYRLRCDGICRVLCQANLHSDQQYHRRIWLVR
uniref:Uncharacterized protein n=1 Tax=Cucumis sativus TaxID=3659 RepID=A0A0A0LUE9_CUCSA